MAGNAAAREMNMKRDVLRIFARPSRSSKGEGAALGKRRTPASSLGAADYAASPKKAFTKAAVTRAETVIKAPKTPIMTGPTMESRACSPSDWIL